MRRLAVVVVALGLGGVAGGVALARAKAPKVAGDWDVNFKQAASTCGEYGIGLGNQVMTMTQQGKTITSAVAQLPIMKGTLKDTGAFALATKRGRSPIEGLKGEFRMTGTFSGDSVQAVLVARYFMGTTPHCEQSWNGTGARHK
jgi:hypothetical protein